MIIIMIMILVKSQELSERVIVGPSSITNTYLPFKFLINRTAIF